MTLVLEVIESRESKAKKFSASLAVGRSITAQHILFPRTHNPKPYREH